VEYLVKKNYFVIRVGSLVNKELKIINENFLDYSTSGNVSDFLDVFIPYKCHFFISSSSGIDGLPSIFRKPILWPSLFPLKCIRSSKNNYMASFRHLKFKNNEKKLTMKDVIKLGLDYCYNSNELEKKNITLCEPSSQDIKMVTQDMVEMLDENENENENENNNINLQNLENNFKNIFSNSELNYKEKIPYHRKNQINFKVSKKFLQTNTWWLK
jgi:putative glycosyltransferase (TIGR04372 family)